MENLKRFYPVIFLSIFTINTVIQGSSSFADACVMIGFVSLLALLEFRFTDAKHKEILNEITKHDGDVDKKIFVLNEKLKELEEVKQHIAGLKMAQQVNMTNPALNQSGSFNSFKGAKF